MPSLIEDRERLWTAFVEEHSQLVVRMTPQSAQEAIDQQSLRDRTAAIRRAQRAHDEYMSRMVAPPNWDVVYEDHTVATTATRRLTIEELIQRDRGGYADIGLNSMGSRQGVTPLDADDIQFPPMPRPQRPKPNLEKQYPATYALKKLKNASH